MGRPADGVKTPRLRLGLIGAGIVGRLHADAAGRCGELWELSAVADPDRGAADRIATEHGASAFDSAEGLLDSGRCDAVVIASPHQEHERQTLLAAAAGIHVLVEKPMAVSTLSAAAMTAACDAAGVVLAVGHIQRYLPAVAAAKQLLDAGAVGAPSIAHLRRSGRYEPGTRPAWFLDPARAAHGIATNIAPHCIDRLHYLTGAEVTHVAASWFQPPGGVATEVTAQLWSAGSVGAGLYLAGTGLPEDDVTDIVGREGALRLSVRDGLTVYRLGEATSHQDWPADSASRAFDAQLADLHAAVLGAGAPPVDGRYGQRIVATIDALARSATAPSPTAVPVEA